MVDVIHRYTCDYCQQVVQETVCHKAEPASHILGTGFAPAGWKYINGMVVCPRHEIIVKDKKEGQ